MKKNIVFCADGTWNGPETQTGVSPIDSSDDHGEVSGSNVTNVVKLFANCAGHVTPETVALQNEQERLATNANGDTQQVTKYIHGVGDSSNPINKLLGGVFGMGVIARVVRGYTFISRNYSAGDDIHIVGFSRGAYTARALAGMITRVGLLNPATYDPLDKMEAYRLGIAAWAKAKGVQVTGQGVLTQLADNLIGFLEAFIAKDLPPNGLTPDVPLKAVAVWDTVGSMGIPLYVDDRRYDLFRFVDTKLNEKVELGFHAMAIDELRRDFPVTRWDDRAGIEQVWFVGAHADVGGGYSPPESRLSDEALSWMMKKLTGAGVTLTDPVTYMPKPQEVGQAIHTPWANPPFNLSPTAARWVLPNDVLHSSVVQRWTSDLGYRPQALGAFASIGLAAVKTDSATYA